jgi:mono/diheme cytochrome c family protein
VSAPVRARRRRASVIVVGALLVLLVLLAALVAWLNVRGEAPLTPDAKAAAASRDVLAQGAYLARAGNCAGCHTMPGGVPFAGGRGVETPFGTVFAPNITPDARTGIGDWTSSEFWRAMHHGRSKDGRLLYPAFPYPSFTLVSREDSDALLAYLRSVKPVSQPNVPHELRFPYSTQAALAVWRALFFRPRAFVPESDQDAQWNRGKYLVQGLGHCAACHSSRNFLGATRLNAEFAGGLMPDEAWYASSLASASEAGVQGWPQTEVVRLLKTGVSAQAAVSGPMAEVVYSSMQYLSEHDVRSMARFLQSIPLREHPPAKFEPASGAVMDLGRKLYDRHCASCHGDQGQGAPSIYPALAGNRAVTLGSPNNLVQLVSRGGFAPSTAGNPRPFGMPPFRHLMSDEEIAAVTTYVRQSWGNASAPVSALDVLRVR